MKNGLLQDSVYHIAWEHAEYLDVLFIEASVCIVASDPCRRLLPLWSEVVEGLQQFQYSGSASGEQVEMAGLDKWLDCGLWMFYCLTVPFWTLKNTSYFSLMC